MRKVVQIAALAVLFLIIAMIRESDLGGYVLLGPRWPGGTTVFYVDIPGRDGLWNTNFEAAMADWNAVTEFEYKIVRNLEDPCDGDLQNGVAFTDTVCGDAFGSNTLAVAATVRSVTTGDYLKANVMFNDNISWSVFEGPFVPFLGGHWQPTISGESQCMN